MLVKFKFVSNESSLGKIVKIPKERKVPQKANKVRNAEMCLNSNTLILLIIEK